MAAPADKTDLERVMDCLAWALGRISHANGFRTDGVLVGRARDPRVLRESLPEQYERYQCALTVTRAQRKLDRARSLGRHVWDCTVTLFGIRTMTQAEDAAGRNLDALASDLQDDVRRAVRKLGDPTSGASLVEAAAALGFTRPRANAIVLDEVHEDEGANFPDAHFVCVVYFRMEEAFDPAA